MGSTAVPNYSGRRAHTLGLSLPLQYLTHCFRFGKAGGKGEFCTRILPSNKFKEKDKNSWDIVSQSGET